VLDDRTDGAGVPVVANVLEVREEACVEDANGTDHDGGPVVGGQSGHLDARQPTMRSGVRQSETTTAMLVSTAPGSPRTSQAASQGLHARVQVEVTLGAPGDRRPGR